MDCQPAAEEIRMELFQHNAGTLMVPKDAEVVSEESSLVDLKSLCRICARVCINSPDLDAIPFSINGNLAANLKDYLKIEVENDSELLPKQVCQECSFALERWTEIQEIVKESEDFYCKQLKLRGMVSEHSNAIYVKMEPEIASPNEAESFSCAKCSEMFTTFDSLVTHELTHMQENTSVSVRAKVKVGKKRKPIRKRAKKKSDLSEESDFDDTEADANYQPVLPATSSSNSKRCSTRNCYLRGQPIECGHCSFTFQETDDFISHLQSLSPGQPIPCTICNCKFNLLDQLIEHTSEHVNNDSRQVQTFPCAHCSSGPFATKSAFQHHSNTTHPPPAPQPVSAFPCGLCSLGFEEFVDYSKHVQTHVNFRHFPCALCGCKFTKVPYLLEHVMQHANGNNRQITFMCEICPDQVFSSKHNLASHMTKKHRMNSVKSKPSKSLLTFESGFFSLHSGQESSISLQCGLCETQVNCCVALASHIDMEHKKFKHLLCKKCHCKFTKLPYYLEHMSEHFANPDKILAIPCEACDEIFSSKHNLSKHIYKKHRNNYAKLSAQKLNHVMEQLPDPEEEPKFEIERDPKTRLFHCKNCPLTFKNATLLNTHLLIHVPNKCPTCHGLFETREQLKEHLTQKCRPEEKFPCPICGKLLASKQSMRIHTSLHSSERKFVCEVCAKSYRTQSALVSHRNVVHLQKSQFMCHICARTFSFKLAMKRHVMLHMGDLPHRCSVCAKAFVTANLLKIHIAKEHERRTSHFCTSCKKGFVDIIGLRRHMRMVCKLPEYAIPYIRDRQFVKHSA